MARQQTRGRTHIPLLQNQEESKTHKLPLIWFRKKKTNQSQQLTWCWFTCLIILSNSSAALPPSVFTSMNKGAGRASSTLTRMQLLVTAAFVLVYLCFVAVYLFHEFTAQCRLSFDREPDDGGEHLSDTSSNRKSCTLFLSVPLEERSVIPIS